MNLGLFSDTYVQNSYHPLGLIDVLVIAFGSIRMLSRALYLIFNQRFNPFSQRRYYININNDPIDPSD